MRKGVRSYRTVRDDLFEVARQLRVHQRFLAQVEATPALESMKPHVQAKIDFRLACADRYRAELAEMFHPDAASFIVNEILGAR
jgi:hypothetical protein